MRILVTGGTGHLGKPVVARLVSRGHDVRVLTRREAHGAGVEWVKGDLGNPSGLAEAVAGVDTIVHAATNSPSAQRGKLRPSDFFRTPTDVDIDGTTTLLEAASRASVRHFVHISIVGLEHTRRLPYFRTKLRAEELVRGSAVPWTIVRATPFYWLLERMLGGMARRRIIALPADVKVQPVDSDDFAAYVVECATGDERGRRQDFAGPEVLSLGDVVRQYLATRGFDRRVINLPLPRRMKASIEAGNTAPDGLRGETTWGQWLARTGADPVAAS